MCHDADVRNNYMLGIIMHVSRIIMQVSVLILHVSGIIMLPSGKISIRLEIAKLTIASYS